MKNLSNEFINLTQRTNFNFKYNIQAEAEEINWEGFPICSLTSNPDSTHFYIKFENNTKLPMEKNSSCSIYKIENGYFEGCYLLIERNAKLHYTDLIIANLTKVLHYISVNKVLTIEEADSLISNENISKRTTEILKRYDITAQRQACVSFCQNLPDQCYLNNKFLKEVLANLSKTRLQIIGAYDPELVKINVCEKRNLDEFKKNIVLAKTSADTFCK